MYTYIPSICISGRLHCLYLCSYYDCFLILLLSSCMSLNSNSPIMVIFLITLELELMVITLWLLNDDNY